MRIKVLEFTIFRVFYKKISPLNHYYFFKIILRLIFYWLILFYPYKQ